MVDSRADLALGDRLCRRVTRRHAKSFHFASRLLPRPARRHSYALYAFCRSADHAVDEAPNLVEAARRIARTRQDLDLAFSEGLAPPMLLALRRTVRERAIPREPFDALLDGMTMDLTVSRYSNFAALDLYCHRAAGVVGLMMAHCFGYRHERCLPRAVALGKAMQLTNILRDVREDFNLGRI